MAYPHKEIDKKWQQAWTEKKAFKAEFPSKKPKYYALDMFPYPSGKGLHVGHLASYTPTDVVSRYKRAQGFNVLHPMGYDAFGLPAEQYAIQTGVHPATTTNQAIESFRQLLDGFGFSFDWDRSISTADPKFYKWTQFIFTELFKKGLAYQKEVAVNWCPALKTVLANEEVIDGKSERGSHPVVRKPMRQWMLKITDYAEGLLKGLDDVDFPDRTKEGQRNWIGKSFGAEVQFGIKGYPNESIEVFTTRPDTIFGASFMVLAPEHPAVLEITPKEKLADVKNYMEASASKSELDRKAAKEKTGCFTGAFALHPITKKELPIWIADYVLIDYGSGAVMSVPAHDERDYEFAQKFGLDIPEVVQGNSELPYTGDGTLINSDFLNGLKKDDAITKIITYLEENKLGQGRIQYKLRDWLFSRQRYWGEPIPILKNIEDGSLKALELNELPLTLPEVANYEPSESGEAPLARNKEWMSYSEKYLREADTMPGSAGSSWYFLRYTDPHNDNELASKEAQDYWMPVDLYTGGPEHTVGHLLYSRFWQRFLFNQGLTTCPEPYQKLAHQGMILGPDGEKMSKSRGNVINPDDVKVEFGSDAIRVYICFMGPYDRDKPWSTESIHGVKRFLDRVWRLCVTENEQVDLKSISTPEETKKSLHKMIKKVSKDIESLSFNTAISAMMIYVNELYKLKQVNSEMVLPLIQCLAPFAPHLCEELWEKLDQSQEHGFVSNAPWPAYDESLCQDDVLTTAVQVNGKTRGTIDIAKTTSESEAVDLAKTLKTVQAQLDGKKIFKVIYKPGRILNIIAK